MMNGAEPTVFTITIQGTMKDIINAIAQYDLKIVKGGDKDEN